MRKLKLLMMACALLGAGQVWADDVFKDVTSTYLTNADFEGEYEETTNPGKSSGNKIARPNGWTLSFTGAASDGTDAVGMNSSYAAWSNFSGCASLATGGNNTYWVRMKWGSSSTLKLSQSVKLPLGSYKLTADYYKNGKGGDGNIYAATQEAKTSTNEDAWKSVNLTFTSDGDANTEIGLKVVHTSSGSDKKLGFDNFVLEWNLTQSLKDLIAEANTFIGGETDSYATLQSAIDAADAVKESSDASTLETQYDELADALDLAKNHRKPWLTAWTTANTNYGSDTYINVVGTEKTDLKIELDKSEPSTAGGYDSAKSAIETANTNFTAAKTNYDLNAAEVTRATDLGVASSTVSTYTAGSTTTSATALTNTQALKVAEYNYVFTNFTNSLTLGDWSPTKIKDESTSPWDDSNAYKASNGYDDASWESSYSQTLELAAGNYIFKVAGRRSISSAMWIEVKNGGSTLGIQNDFPKASTGLGINTIGATDFTTGEGHTYANSGNGYGWEWRYVKFTLSEKTTVTVAIKGSAGVRSQWINFSGYQVLADDDVNVSFYEYYKSLNKAIDARDDDTYANVQGTDRSGLEGAINAEPGSTTTTINAAKSALDAAYDTFTDGVASWDGYTLAKSYSDAAASLAYATTAKKEAVTTAKNATVNTAAEALTQTDVINTANRQAYESHALAEAVSGAESITISDPNMDVTYDGTAHTFGAWQVFGQTDGDIQLKDETESLTDGEGYATYKYANIWKSDNNAGIKQTLSDLPAGKYMLTVAARAQATASATFGLFAGDTRTEITRIGNSGGVFDRGWNDVSVEFVVYETSDVNIGVQSGNGKSLWWSATRFRLVRLGDETESVTVSTAGFATYVSSNALDFTLTGIEAYKVNVEEPGVATLTKVGQVPAKTPVLLYKKGGDTEDIPVLVSASGIGDNDLVAGTGATVPTYETVSTTDDYTNMILNNGDYGIGFYYANDQIVATNRAYLHIASSLAPDAEGSGSRMVMVFADETTGVNDVRSKMSEVRGTYYNLNGQRVEKPAKGLYIVNGKKVIIK